MIDKHEKLAVVLGQSRSDADTGAQILRNGGKCDGCICRYGWSGCPRLSMSDEKYSAVRYRENQT